MLVNCDHSGFTVSLKTGSDQVNCRFQCLAQRLRGWWQTAPPHLSVLVPNSSCTSSTADTRTGARARFMVTRGQTAGRLTLASGCSTNQTGFYHSISSPDLNLDPDR